MPTCEGIVPECTYPIRSVVQVDEHGNALKDEHGEIIKEIVTETTPAHPCEAEATMLSRSMREVVGSALSAKGAHEHPLVWERVSDVLYCATCFVPGTMTHLSGLVTQHPAMAVSDA